MQTIDEIQFQIMRNIETGRIDNARLNLSKAFEIAPQNPKNYILAATISIEEEDYQRARKESLEALRLDPNSYEGRTLLAEVAQEEGKFPESEELLLGLLREHPESGHLYAKVAMLMIKALEISRARDYANEAYRLSPHESLTRIIRILFAIIDNEPSAKDEMGQLLKDAPEAEHTLRVLVAYLTHKKRYREGFAVAQHILCFNPRDRDLIKLVIELRVLSHWSTTPLLPMAHWGWFGSGVIWIIAMMIIASLRAAELPVLQGIFVSLFLIFVIYSWVYPSILRRWFRFRGV